jgi:hypothetical protein
MLLVQLVISHISAASMFPVLRNSRVKQPLWRHRFVGIMPKGKPSSTRENGAGSLEWRTKWNEATASRMTAIFKLIRQGFVFYPSRLDLYWNPYIWKYRTVSSNKSSEGINSHKTGRVRPSEKYSIVSLATLDTPFRATFIYCSWTSTAAGAWSWPLSSF